MKTKDPSEELKNVVDNATNMEASVARKWAELFQKIPIYQDGWTPLGALHDLMSDTWDEYKNEGPFIFRIRVELEPAANHGESVVCLFMPDNKASIDQISGVSGPTEHLADKNFFGFKGTWEEVVRKIVEINNFLTNPAPLFPENLIITEESKSLAETEKEQITKSLEKHKGKRNLVADELGISQRQLYRKIQEYQIH